MLYSNDNEQLYLDRLILYFLQAPPNDGKKTGGASAEDRKKSYEHHDHCHKVQKSPTHTVPVKPSKYDELGAMLAAEEKLHKKERHLQHHHNNLHGCQHPHANQPGLAHQHRQFQVALSRCVKIRCVAGWIASTCQYILIDN